MLTAADLAIVVFMVPLLFASAFFSSSETALFRLVEAQRGELRRRGSPAARAVLSLLARPREVLITILLGNMTVNVLYFLAGSVLLLRLPVSVGVEIALAAATLLVLVIAGEVFPKMAATTRPMGAVLLLAPPLLLLHRVLAPIRRTVDVLVVRPLSRLATSSTPRPLDGQELAALVDLSSREGVLDRQEQQVLRDVVEFGHIRVREVMTPRVRMISLPSDARDEDVRRIASKTHLTRIPVHGKDVDEIVGMLQVKRYLRRGGGTLRESILEPRFIPQAATLDGLLRHFRETGSPIAIVVDEYGGTAGVVAVEDILEELVGEIGNQPNQPRPPQELEDERWLLDGDTPVREWADAFGQFVDRSPAATLGGLIMAELGRIPAVGDAIDLGNVRLEVHEMDQYRVDRIVASLQEQGQ